jgi:hypothetical protein
MQPLTIALTLDEARRLLVAAKLRAETDRELATYARSETHHRWADQLEAVAARLHAAIQEVSV